MADPRGRLALVYLAIADRYRPNWLVWENVPGVLSKNEGRDFGSIVGGMVKLGYGIAYRVLDAQYVGVPQRRRRVFVVGYLGDWRRAAEILFEPSCLRRNPPPGRKTRSRITEGTISRALTSSPTATGRLDPNEQTFIPGVVGALSDGAKCGGGTNGQDAYTGRIIPTVAAPLTAGSSAPGVSAPGRRREDDENLVTFAADDYRAGSFEEINSARPLTTSADRTRAAPIVAFAQNQRDEVRLMDKAGALAADPGAKQQTYVFTERGREGGSNLEARADGTANAILTPNGGRGGTGVGAICHQMAVRRLTPLECERLQGFPDGYTNIPGASDSGRYKALGNSMAVPVMRWIGERITAVCQGQEHE